MILINYTQTKYYRLLKTELADCAISLLKLHLGHSKSTMAHPDSIHHQNEHL